MNAKLPRPASVLVVDDQREIRRLLSISLGREVQVLEAVDGASALALVREHRPDVVLLDVMMPGGLDGLQVLEALRADPANTHMRVAMISARGQAADIAAAEQRGADAYFTKPFSPLAVLAWVQRVLGHEAGDDFVATVT